MRYLTVYEGQSFLIKRKEDSDKLSAFNLVFICSTMSKNHAKLFLKDGVFYVEDLNSTNGTKINGIHIEPNVPSVLTDGDEVQFGVKILFDFKRKKVPATKCMIKIPWKQ